MSLAIIFWLFILPSILGVSFVYLMYQTFYCVKLPFTIGLSFLCLLPIVGYLMIFAYCFGLMEHDHKYDYREDTHIGKFFYDSFKF